MKVEQSSMVKLKLTDVKGLDPVSVMIEEYKRGEAKVIIDCYGKSWSSYWGSMGGDLKEFFTRTNVSYLVNCFDRGISDTTEEVDYESTKEGMKDKLKKYILEERRESCLRKEEARIVMGDLDGFIDSLKLPEHSYDNYETTWLHEDKWKCVFFDKDDLNCWFWDRTGLVYETNHEYYYLERIVTAVKESVMNFYDKEK